MIEPQLKTLPLVFDDIVEQLYEFSPDPETQADQRLLWDEIHQGLTADLSGFLANLDNWSPEARAADCHRVGGYAASSGLQRCSAALHSIEKSDADVDIAAVLRLAMDGAEAGISEIEHRFPHLLTPATG